MEISPQVMEDKWFWYYEDDNLYIHRSWTGLCIFVVSFTPDSDELHVLVNRDPEQYRSTDVNQDEYELNRLLTWWTQSDHDPCNQFLADTYRALLKRIKSRPFWKRSRAVCTAVRPVTRWDMQLSS